MSSIISGNYFTKLLCKCTYFKVSSISLNCGRVRQFLYYHEQLATMYVLDAVCLRSLGSFTFTTSCLDRCLCVTIMDYILFKYIVILDINRHNTVYMYYEYIHSVIYINMYTFCVRDKITFSPEPKIIFEPKYFNT